ncbi:MAG TPA: YfiR family protein [Thermoanaerobaculia bacterium]|nr:YfiR family protein [Thermoanaerobaculia bacterium]
MALLRASQKALRLLLCAWGLATSAAAGAEVAASEYAVKAAFLYNFTKFVDWPPRVFTDERSPLKICVLGADPFGKALRSFMDEEVGGRRLQLLRVDTLNNPAACHVLFVSRSERDRLPQILAAVRGAPVLTVADTPEFLDDGGMVNFVLEGGKVRFEIDPEAAERSGIRISSKLLALARHVKGRP